MQTTFALFLALIFSTGGMDTQYYLPSIQQRWDVSDLVCIGNATTPVRTGRTEFIDGRDRDQLSADIDLQTCLKGDCPKPSRIRVFDYDVFAEKDLEGGSGYGYSGPPTGFVRKGRNLLFLRKTDDPGEYQTAVLIYATAIPLADEPPIYPAADSAGYVRAVVTRELEAALLQEDRGQGTDDLTDIGYLFDWLGGQRGIDELSSFAKSAPLPVQRDLALRLLSLEQKSWEPEVISLLLDSSAPAWKRENAARALGRSGTAAAVGPLRQVAMLSGTTQQAKSLQEVAQESLRSVEHRTAK